MSSPPTNKNSIPTKKDTTVAIVIGQQRRVSETKNKANNDEDFSKSNGFTNEKEDKVIKNKLEHHLLQASKNSETKKKFLINDILQQKTLEEQSLPASHHPLHLMQLFRRGIIRFHRILLFLTSTSLIRTCKYLIIFIYSRQYSPCHW